MKQKNIEKMLKKMGYKVHIGDMITKYLHAEKKLDFGISVSMTFEKDKQPTLNTSSCEMDVHKMRKKADLISEAVRLVELIVRQDGIEWESD